MLFDQNQPRLNTKYLAAMELLVRRGRSSSNRRAEGKIMRFVTGLVSLMLIGLLSSACSTASVETGASREPAIGETSTAPSDRPLLPDGAASTWAGLLPFDGGCSNEDLENDGDAFETGTALERTSSWSQVASLVEVPDLYGDIEYVDGDGEKGAALAFVPRVIDGIRWGLDNGYPVWFATSDGSGSEEPGSRGSLQLVVIDVDGSPLPFGNCDAMAIHELLGAKEQRDNQPVHVDELLSLTGPTLKAYVLE